MQSINRGIAAAAALLLLLSVGACGKKDDAAVDTTAIGPTPDSGPLRVSDIELGRRIGPDKKINDETDDFAAPELYVADAEGGALADFFTKDVIQEEFPNRLSPIGAHRELNALLDASRKGKQTLRAQKYDILNSIADGDSVALEVFWSGYLAVPVDTLPADSEVRAHLAIWLEFRDGKICRQHNYDCFDPWWV